MAPQDSNMYRTGPRKTEVNMTDIQVEIITRTCKAVVHSAVRFPRKIASNVVYLTKRVTRKEDRDNAEEIDYRTAQKEGKLRSLTTRNTTIKSHAVHETSAAIDGCSNDRATRRSFSQLGRKLAATINSKTGTKDFISSQNQQWIDTTLWCPPDSSPVCTLTSSTNSASEMAEISASLPPHSAIMAREISRTGSTQENALHSISEAPEADKTIINPDSRISQNNFGKVPSILTDANDSAHETPVKSEEAEHDLARDRGTDGIGKKDEESVADRAEAKSSRSSLRTSSSMCSKSGSSNDVSVSHSSRSSIHADSDDDEADADEADADEADAIWGPVLSILPSEVAELVSTWTSTSESVVSDVTVKSGQNNRVFIVHFEDSTPQVCVRVPACGWESRWTDSDRAQLRHTVNMMTFIRDNTSVPVPAVVHFNTEFDNPINAPYIAMEYVAGVAPLEAWYGKKGADGGTFWIDNDSGDAVDTPDYEQEEDFTTDYKPLSSSLESKRQTMLKTLAAHMAELRTFSFNKMGSPIFSADGKHIEDIGPTFANPFGVFARSLNVDDVVDAAAQIHPVADMNEFLFEEAKSWFKAYCKITEERWDADGLAHSERGLHRESNKGLFNFLYLVISCLPNTVSLTDPLEEFEGLSRLFYSADQRFDDTHNTNESEDPGNQEHRFNPAVTYSPNQLPFVLTNPDFGSQNILCDPDTGAVTAVLDWDRTTTVPRYIGWCLPPCWLLHDYWSKFSWFRHPIEGNTMHSRDYELYRANYADYLRASCLEAGDECSDDYKFTQMGPIFDKLVEVIKCQNIEQLRSLVTNMLEGMFPRADQSDILHLVFRSGLKPGMETMMKAEVKKYLRLIDDDEFRRTMYGTD